MKKYIVFLISFVISFVLLQLIYGAVLLFNYTPDIAGAWDQVGSLSSSVVITGSTSFMPVLFVALLAATVAYFTPKLFMKEQ